MDSSHRVRDTAAAFQMGLEARLFPDIDGLDAGNVPLVAG
jgi:hypothetical protein